MKKYYALFKKEPIVTPGGIWSMFEGHGEEWKRDEKYKWEFVKFGTPKEIAKEIREEYGEYRVLEGKLHTVKTMSTFFVGGKNLDTMEAEWS